MDFDLNLARSIVTVASLIVFVALVAWTWGRSRKAAYDEAARLAIMDEAPSPERPEQQ